MVYHSRILYINVFLYNGGHKNLQTVCTLTASYACGGEDQRSEYPAIDLIDPFAVVPLLLSFVSLELVIDHGTRQQVYLGVCDPNIKKGVLLPRP